jgi:hypothetical protein
MTSATTTRARGMGRRHAEGYGLIVFASVLLLVPDDHRGRRGRATEPVCLWQPREPGCLALICVDRPQLARMVTSGVLASVAMVITYRARSALWAIDRRGVLRHLLVRQRPPCYSCFFGRNPPWQTKAIGAQRRGMARLISRLRGVILVGPQTYEITFAGQAGSALAAEFDDCNVIIGPGTTTLRVELPDQGALWGIVQRIIGLGLEVIHMHLIAPPPSSGGTREDSDQSGIAGNHPPKGDGTSETAYTQSG